MPIEFHCPKCNKPIRAPDDSGGKRGKCPSCEQSVYIPTPPDEIEPLDLEPLDEEEERKREQLLEETRKLTDEVRHAQNLPPDSGAKSPNASPMEMRPDVERLVIQYVLAMADGRLDEAEQFAATIKRQAQKAAEVVQRITMDEMPPDELQKIPRPVLNGFLKQLQA